MNLVTKLSERIEVLEDDLKKTKQTYSSAFTKLILRIKKLESKGRIDEDLNTYFAQDDEVVHDQDTAKRGQPEDSTSERSKETRKDKGKAIMTEPEPVRKSKKLLEQERPGLEEAIRLQKQVDEEEKYWYKKNKPKSEAQARKNMIVYLKNQSNYKMKDFEGMSYDEIRPIFEKIWDFNHNFVPMDLEIDKEKKKPAGVSEN
ncbi:hypothetical protein Tco_0030999 [Tanacetum coccineum]